MEESRAIALWAAALGGSCLGLLTLAEEMPPLRSWPLISAWIAPAPPSDPLPAAIPVPAVVTAPLPPNPPRAAPEPAVEAPPPLQRPPRLRPRPGDNEEARRYTDALNALSYEGYSGVDWIAPLGRQFRASAILEGRRVEVIIDPDTGTVTMLAPPR